MDVLQGLVDRGNTVIVIEHNLDVIKNADWLVDLGPEGGDGGGRIVATGTPEQVAQVPESYTGQFLATSLPQDQPPGVKDVTVVPAPTRPGSRSARNAAKNKAARVKART